MSQFDGAHSVIADCGDQIHKLQRCIQNRQKKRLNTYTLLASFSYLSAIKESSLASFLSADGDWISSRPSLMTCTTEG